MAVKQELYDWAIEQEQAGVSPELIANALPKSKIDPDTGKWAAESLAAGYTPEQVLTAFKKSKIIPKTPPLIDRLQSAVKSLLTPGPEIGPAPGVSPAPPTGLSVFRTMPGTVEDLQKAAGTDTVAGAAGSSLGRGVLDIFAKAPARILQIAGQKAQGLDAPDLKWEENFRSFTKGSLSEEEQQKAISEFREARRIKGLDPASRAIYEARKGQQEEPIGKTIGEAFTGLREKTVVPIAQAVERGGAAAADFISEKSEELFPRAEKLRGKGVFDSPEIMADPLWWADNGPETFTSMLAALVPGLGAAKWGKLAASAAGGLSGGSLEGVGAYERAVQKGMSPREATRAFEQMTAASTILNALGLGKILEKTKSTSPVIRALKHLMAATTEATTEMAEEPAQALIVGDDVKQALKDSLNVGPLAFVMGGGASVATGLGDQKTAPKPAPEQAPQEPAGAAGTVRPAPGPAPAEGLEQAPTQPSEQDADFDKIISELRDVAEGNKKSATKVAVPRRTIEKPSKSVISEPVPPAPVPPVASQPTEQGPVSGPGQPVAPATPPAAPAAAAPRTEVEESRDRLHKKLTESGLTPEHPAYQAAMEEHRTVSRERDRVTGFEPVDYLERKMQRAVDSKEESSYGAVDIKNLGGLNDKYGGEEAANPDVREIADIIRNTVNEITGRRSNEFIRKGGDEFSVVARGVPQQLLDKALKTAKLRVDEWAKTKGHETLEHPKAFDKEGRRVKAPGVGIYYGTAPLTDIQTAFRDAEKGVYVQKSAFLTEQEQKGGQDVAGRAVVGQEVQAGTPAGQAVRAQEGPRAEVRGGEQPAAAGGPAAAPPAEVTPPNAGVAEHPAPPVVPAAAPAPVAPTEKPKTTAKSILARAKERAKTQTPRYYVVPDQDNKTNDPKAGWLVMDGQTGKPVVGTAGAELAARRAVEMNEGKPMISERGPIEVKQTEQADEGQQDDSDDPTSVLYKPEYTVKDVPGGILVKKTGEPSPTKSLLERTREKAQASTSKNTVFTDDAAAKAREILRKKLSQTSMGVDPEILQAGITLAGYHIERGARTFSAYSVAMIKDLGEKVKPYLKSWYMAVKYDPRATAFSDQMSSAEEVEKDLTAPSKKEAISVGEWLEGSAVKNIVYHGTGSAFELFAKEKIGESTGVGDLGEGFYFTDDPAIASSFAGGDSPNVRPSYLSIKNPATNAVLDTQEMQDIADDMMGFKSMQDALAEKGYDGIIYTHKGGKKEYVVFSPEQIRSAFEQPKAAASAEGKPLSPAKALLEKAKQKAVSKRAAPGEKAALLSRLDRGEIDQILAEWKGAELTDDNDILVVEKRGGGGNYTHTWGEFIDWLRSDEPATISDDAEWAELIKKAQAVIKPATIEAERKEAADDRTGDRGNRPAALEGSKPGGLPEDAGERGPRKGERGSRPTDATGDERPDAGRPVRSGSVAGKPGAVRADRPAEDVQPVTTEAPTPPSEPRTGTRAGANPGNYRITDADRLGQGTPGQKIDGNLAAIRLVKQLDAENRYATPAEQAVLAKYVGWGGLKGVFNPHSKSQQEQVARAELEKILTKEEYHDAFQTTLNAHYTSSEIIGTMYRVLDHFGFKGGNVLEPTYGTGNFIGLMPQHLAESSKWYGSELDPITAAIGRHLYPDAQLINAGFQNAEFPYGTFDLAIGNPPFGDERITDKNAKRKDIDGMKIHNYVIAKGGMHLRPGGIMAMVVTHRFLDTADPEARNYLAKNFKFLGAVRLPNDAFKATAGTQVTTDLVFFQRLMPGETASEQDKTWTERGAEIQTDDGIAKVNRYFAEHPELMLGKPSSKDKLWGGKEGQGFTLWAKEGQDTRALMDGILKDQWADLADIYADNTTARLDAAAVAIEMNKENVSVGGYVMDGNDIYMRGDDDALGNVQMEKLTPKTLWSTNLTPDGKGGYTWEGMRDKKKVKEHYKTEAAVPNQFRLGDTRMDRIRGMLRLRNMTYDLIRAEKEDSPSIEPLRRKLNKEYDAFVEKYGFISDSANFSLIADDVKIEAGLELNYRRPISEARAKVLGVKPLPARADKAAILRERTQFPYREITSAENARDGYKVSLSEKGKLDIPYVAKLTGQTEEDAISEMSEAGLIFKDPDSGEWVQEDLYLSGNVKKKLKAAQGRSGYEKNAAALEKVLPKDVPTEDITVELGATWVPAEAYKDFAEFLGINSANIFISPETGRVSIASHGPIISNDMNVLLQNTDYDAAKLFNLLANKKPVVAYDTDSDGKRHVNPERTKALTPIAKRLRSMWTEWLFADPIRARELTQVYNDTQNTIADRKTDGSLLRTVGQNPAISLYDTQKNAAWRAIQSDSMLYDHVVGAGKTFSIITAAMERKRLGLTRKSVIVVPNHLVGQWSRDFLTLYPGAHILAATNKDFAKTNRRRLMGRIATGNFDAVIIGHSSLAFIPIEAETEKRFLEAEIADLRRALVEAEKAKDKNLVRTIANRIAKREEKIKRLMSAPKDDVISFENSGIDYLVLDESQEFKNLAYSTYMQNIAGMGDPEGSRKAFDLYAKLQVIREKGGGVAFATGTPISNSAVEMYSLLRYLNPQGLKDRKLDSFDAWAKTFASVENEVVMTPSRKLKDRSVMSEFANLPELMQLYREFADIVSMDDLKKSYTEQVKKRNKEQGTKDREDFPVPKVAGGKRRLVLVKPSERQEEYVDYLVARADLLEENKGDPEYKSVDNHLWLMNDAMKMALDVRLVDPTLPADPDNKIKRSAKEIKRIYDKWNKDKGVQLVFCDLSTPVKDSDRDARSFITAASKMAGVDKDNRVQSMLEPMSYQEKWDYLKTRIEARIEQLGNSREDTAGDEIEKLAKYLDDVTPEDLAALTTVDTKFSVYDDLKATLVKMGLQEGEVRFIHEAKTQNQKDELFAQVQAGQVRVLIGSSKKMGAGTNVQNRLVALHHLDAPWRPSDIEQREGRIIRQGNELYLRDPENFEVEIMAYSTEATLDAQRWQVLARKQKMIEGLKSGERKIKEENMDSMSYSEFMAEATGNPAFREKFKLENDIEELEATERKIAAQRSAAEGIIKKEAGLRADAKKAVETAETELAATADSPGFKLGDKTYKEDLSATIEQAKLAHKTAWKEYEEKTWPEYQKANEPYAAWEKERDAFAHHEATKVSKGKDETLVDGNKFEKAFDQYRKEYEKSHPAPEKVKQPSRPVDHSESLKHLAKTSEAAQAAMAIVKDLDAMEAGSVEFEYGGATVAISKAPSSYDEKTSDFTASINGKAYWSKRGVIHPPESYILDTFSDGHIHQELQFKVSRAKRSEQDTDASIKNAHRVMDKVKFEDAEKMAGMKKRFAELVEEVNRLEAEIKERRAGKDNRFINRDTDRPFGQLDKGEKAERPGPAKREREAGEEEGGIEFLHSFGSNLIEPIKKALSPASRKVNDSVKMPAGVEDLESHDPEVEARFQSAKLTKTRLVDRVRTAVQHAKEQTKHIPGLDYEKDAKVVNILRNFENIPEYSRYMAVDITGAITKGLGPKKYDVFTRNIILPDLVKDIENGLYGEEGEEAKDLPFGYKDLESVQRDLEKYRAIAQENPDVQEAIERREAFHKTLTEALVRSELLPEKVLEDDRYFHHQVIAYMDIKRQGVSSQDVRTHKKGWQRGRVGSAQDYNTDYLEAEYEYISQALSQLKTKEALGQIKKAADISAELKKQAKAKSEEDRQVDWKDLLPEGYVLWQPKQGSAFYRAVAVPDMLIDEILSQGSAEVSEEDLRQVLAVGKRRQEWAIPENVATVLDNFRDFGKMEGFDHFVRATMATWKQWTLLNPIRVLRYNLNNLSGDLDIVLAYNPKILKYLGAGATDAWHYYKHGTLTADMQDALKYGVINTGLTIQEIPDIKTLGVFRSLAGKEDPNVLDKWWEVTKGLTQFRENILRMAAFKHFLAEIQSGKTLYGASRRNLVDAESDPHKKAAMLARDLIGDYGNISAAGRWLRERVIPFWSWMEINAPRYVRLLQNMKHEDGTASAAGRGAIMATLGTARLTAKFAVKAGMLYALMQLWNEMARRMFDIDDDELRLLYENRNQLQLIVGRREDGTVMTLRFQGALSDALDWVGLGNAPQDAQALATGRKTWQEQAKDMVKAPVNRLVNAAHPMAKTAFEVATGRALYPDVARPKPIRDKTEHVARLFSLDGPYRWLAGKPTRGGGQSLLSAILYSNDPGEAAYWNSRKAVMDWMDEQGRGSSIMPTEKDNALYYHKQAIKYGDDAAAKKYLKEYVRLGGTLFGTANTITAGKPLGSLTFPEQAMFKKTLRPDQERELRLAEEWYRKTYEESKRINLKDFTEAKQELEREGVKIKKPVIPTRPNLLVR